jgi:Heparinase II/III-like protein
MTHRSLWTLPTFAFIGGITVLSAIACTPRSALVAPTATMPSGRAMTPDPLSHARTGHPRLFADTQRFASLSASTAPLVQDAIQDIVREADFLRGKPILERKLDGFRLLAVSRGALLRIGTLAAAYRLRGDVASGQAACRQLLAIARFSDWNPVHYLDVAEMTLAAAIGYDWCYDLLSPAERAEVRAAISNKGLRPSEADPPLDWVAGKTNWTQVCHAGMLAGALVIHDEEPALARRIIARALLHLPKAMDAIYDPSGNYPEGPMYWGYGTHYNLIAIEALRSVLGDDGGLGQHRGLRASGFFFAHVHGATGQPFCYGDCLATTPDWVSNAPGLAWLARENGVSSLLPPAPRMRLKPTEDANVRFLPFLPLWLGIGQGREETLPLDYVGGGLRQIWLARSAWHNAQAAYLGVTGGSPGDPHGHMDAGSFVFELDGVRWAHDLGMHPYEALEKGGVNLWDLTQASPRWSVFRLGADAHNIIQLPGGPQDVTGRAELTVHDEDAASPTCDVELTSLYAPRAVRVQRQFHFPGRSALEITDRISDVRIAGTIRWQLMTHAAVTLDPASHTVHLREAGKFLDLTVQQPASVRLTTTAAGPSLPCEQPNPGFTRVVVEVDAVVGASPVIQVRLARP